MSRSVIALLMIWWAFAIQAQEEIEPPKEFAAFDTPNDKGETISVTWRRSPDEQKKKYYYVVYISHSKDGPWFIAGKLESSSSVGFKSDKPEYFWYLPDNKYYRWIEIYPHQIFTELEHKLIDKVLSKVKEIQSGFEALKSTEDVGKINTQIEGIPGYLQEAIQEIFEPNKAELSKLILVVQELFGAQEAEQSEQRINSLSTRLSKIKEELKNYITQTEQINEVREKGVEFLKNETKWMEELKKQAQERYNKYKQELLKRTYYFKLGIEGKEPYPWIVSASAKENWFNFAKINNFLFVIGFSVVILLFIKLARTRALFLRRIPGLDAIDEAIGRATEMGKPVFYLTGRDAITSISTIAATTILGEVARKVATYETTLKVPHTDPIVTVICQEITKEAYTRAGRPDLYKNDINFFITTDQFGYTAAVDGMMVREKPAACFFMGYYYAEALILAETGASTGAIQIAGTDADHQLPFFVAACDYTLIGEELYAASAYLSKEPVLLGTIRGQDIGKILLMFIIFAGTVVVTLAVVLGWTEWLDTLMGIFKAT